MTQPMPQNAGQWGPPPSFLDQQQPMSPEQAAQLNAAAAPGAPTVSAGMAMPAPPPMTPSAGQFSMPTGGDPFGDPTKGNIGNPGPSARHLIAGGAQRTVIIIPKSIDESNMHKGMNRPQLTLDLYVVDGGPLEYGDSLDAAAPRPNTHRVDTPAFFSNIQINNKGLVDEGRALLQQAQMTGQQKMTVGVVQQGNKGNRPALLTRCETDLDGNTRPDGAQRREAARQLWFNHQSGAWTPPVPVVIFSPANQQAQAAQQGYVQYPGAQMPPQQQPQTTAQPVYASPQQGWGQPVAGQQIPGVTYAQAPAQAQVQQQPPAAGQPTELPPAPGWAPEVWANLQLQAREQIWAQHNATQGQQGTPAGGQQPGW